MKKLFRISGFVAAVLMMVSFGHKSEASHFQGSDLTYTCVAPGTYVVTFRVFRDCSGATLPTSASLNMRSPGCNTGRSVNMTQIAGSTSIGNLYCPQLGLPQCTSNGKPNFETVSFSATVTFSAAEQNCPNWIFSTTNNARPSIENLVNSSSQDLYSEAYVNLGTPAAPYNNNSPEFNPLNVPIPLVCVNQNVFYSLNANEADGDSLSYELAQPLGTGGTPIPYGPAPGGGIITNPSPKPPYNTGANQQFAILQGGLTTFTITWPLPSYNLDWNHITPPNTVPDKIITATPFFNLDPISGQLTFRPSVYYPNTPSSAGRNKYAVVVKIKEWRNVNGVWVNVGYIRRDILFLVEDCSGNIPPVTTVPPIPPKFEVELNDTLVKVQTCNTTRILYKFQDQQDNVTITVDTAKVRATLPNGSMKVFNNGTKKVEAELFITPDVSDANKTYLIPIKIEDDACPIKGITNQVYRIQVRKQSLARVVGNQSREICLGKTTDLDVNLNRPDSLLNQPTSYSYQWSLHPTTPNGDGLPSVTNQRMITVKPTKTTRYLLTASNVTKGGCTDTTSVLVKVNPNPIINDIKVGYAQGREDIIFGRDAQITVSLGNADTTGFKFRWSPGANMKASNGRPDSTILKELVNPDSANVNSPNYKKPGYLVLNPKVTSLKTRTFKLTVTSETECESSKEVEVKVGPFFLPNVITPNGDGKNDFFEYKGIEPNTSLQIFNRWGVLVKDYKSYDNSFNGKGVSDGTYYYILKEPNGGKSFKGWFDIVK
jgi:gliding motility-associated-like protein